VVESSGDILRLAESLSKRLLGTYTQVRDEDVHLNAASTEKPSPAQLAAKEVFITNLTSGCRYYFNHHNLITWFIFKTLGP